MKEAFATMTPARTNCCLYSSAKLKGARTKKKKSCLSFDSVLHVHFLRLEKESCHQLEHSHQFFEFVRSFFTSADDKSGQGWDQGEESMGLLKDISLLGNVHKVKSIPAEKDAKDALEQLLPSGFDRED